MDKASADDWSLKNCFSATLIKLKILEKNWYLNHQPKTICCYKLFVIKIIMAIEVGPANNHFVVFSFCLKHVSHF